MLVAPFAAEVRTVYDAAAGLPSDDITSLAIDSSGSVWAATRAGLAQGRDGRWTSQRVEASQVAPSGADTFFAAQGALWQLASSAAPKRVTELPAQPRHISAGTPLLLATDT